MNSNELIWSSIGSLYNWVQNENYCGWDPYDVLNSKLIEKLCMGLPLLEILATQFNKYSIINFRPFLNVKKGIDVKGMALFAQSFSKLYNITNDEKYKNDALTSMLFLKNKSLKSKYGYDCWAGHYYNYRSASKNTLSPNVPDVITTSNVVKAIVDNYFIFERDDFKDMGGSAYDFLVNCLLSKTENNECYVMYKPSDENKIVINASAEGLYFVSKLMYLFEDDNMKQIAYDLSQFLIRNQEADGSWVYSKYNGKIRHQIDFHQGFILDSLIEFLPFADNSHQNDVINCIENGAKFYRKNQFLDDGRSHFRYPRLYPIDIHNQAQGIITFSRLSSLNSEYLDFAKKIVDWTVSNMQDNSGYFYYQNYNLFTNRTPHMRWGQAWMMLALSTYLEKERG